MGPSRFSHPIASFACSFACLFVALFMTLSVVGCGSDSDIDPYESKTTRAIREKVRADMEADRLRRVGQRIAAVHGVANGPKDAAPAESGSAEAVGTPLERGQASYAQYCASCHGATGRGDGPVAATLIPQPAKHADGTYMNALSNDHLMKVIKNGGTAVGKSSLMAPWGTTLSDDQIREVIEFIRSLADPPHTGANS